MIIAIRNSKGVDIEIKYESDEVFNVAKNKMEFDGDSEDVRVYEASEWLSQKLIDELLEIFEHTDDYESIDEIKEETATIYNIANIYGIRWVANLIVSWEEGNISDEELLFQLHENT